MMPNTTTHSTGIATAKTRAAFTSMVNAMIIEPKTMTGEREKSRSVRFTPDCTCVMSLVMRVIMVEVPIRSMSEKESFCV